jgi:hypothetical protein
MLFCPRCHRAVPVPPHLAGPNAACPTCGTRLVAPPQAFDPYYTWLGIPPSEQPPNHYRLLGLQLFEANLQVIEHATDRQMKHLQAFKLGPNVGESQRLLNEVSAARVVLLDPAAKASYDQELHRSLARSAAPAYPPEARYAPAQETMAPPPTVSAMPAAFRAPGRRRPKSRFALIALILGGVLGSVMGVFAVFYLTGQDLLGLSGKLRGPTPAETVEDEHDRSVAMAPEPVVEEADAPAVVETPNAEEPVRPGSASQRPAAPAAKSTANPEEKPPVTGESKSPPAAPAEVSQPTLADLIHPSRPSRPPDKIPGVALPAVDSTARIQLVRLASEPSEPPIVELLDDLAELPANQRIELAEDPQGRGWAVNFKSETPSSTSATIAVIRREATELEFSWVLPLTEPQARRKLKNCLLMVQQGAKTTYLQLRESLVVASPTFDLNKEGQTIEIPVADLPGSGQLQVRFDDLDRLPRGGKLKSGGDVAGLAKPVEINFEDMPGVVLELRFLRPASGKLTLRIEPQFREADSPLFRATSNQFELTFARLEKYRTSLETMLTKTRASLPALQTEVERLNRNLATLTSTRPTTPQQQVQLQNARLQAKALVDAGAQRVTVLQSQITDTQVRLSALPEIKSFMDSLHRKAALKFKIFATAGDQEVIFVDATEEA